MIETVHPVADEWTEEYALFSASATRVLLTEPLHRFLQSAVEAGRKPVLLTGPDASVSSLAALALGRFGAFWAVRDASGVFDGLSGHQIFGFSDLWAPARIDQPRLPKFGTPREDSIAVLMAEVYVQQRIGGVVNLGKVACEVISGLGGDPLDVAGAFEPLIEHWNDGAITEAIRRTMPDSDVVNGRAADGSFVAVSAGRVKRGVHELVKGGVPVGPYNQPKQQLIDRADAMLRGLHEDHNVTLAFVAVADFDAGATQRPAARRPEAPIAVLLGPSVVYELGPDLNRLAQRHDLTVLGRARTPSVLVRFSGPDEGLWSQLLSLVGDLGPDKVRRVMMLEAN